MLVGSVSGIDDRHCGYFAGIAGGSFQMMLGGASSQMVRITLKLDDCCVPEISANKYALNIRFTRPDSEHRRQSDSSIDVPFDITFCNF